MADLDLGPGVTVSTIGQHLQPMWTEADDIIKAHCTLILAAEKGLPIPTRCPESTAWLSRRHGELLIVRG